MELTLIQLVIFVVTTFAVDITEASYNRLNDYLIKKVNNDYVESNMEAAFELLGQREGSYCLFCSNSAKLRRFTALQKVIEDTKCDHSAYEIMRANDKEVNLYALLRSNQVIRRVDKVILKIIRDHAARCLQVYPAVYLNKREQADKAMLEKVDNLLNIVEFDDRNHYRSSEHLFTAFIKYKPTFLIVDGGKVLYNALTCKNTPLEWIGCNSGAENDPDFKYAFKIANERTGKTELNANKLRGLVKKYLIEPCRQFVAQFGPDLFIPARFDGLFLLNLDDSNLEYYRRWSSFTICQILTENEAAVLDRVVEHISSK